MGFFKNVDVTIPPLTYNDFGEVWTGTQWVLPDKDIIYDAARYGTGRSRVTGRLKYYYQFGTFEELCQYIPNKQAMCWIRENGCVIIEHQKHWIIFSGTY